VMHHSLWSNYFVGFDRSIERLKGVLEQLRG